MPVYLVKKSDELSDAEIKTILDTWDVEEWNQLNVDEFKDRFAHSEFHLLTDESVHILSFARINFKFKVRIDESVYNIAELVGFVAVEILKGYDKTLLDHLSDNLKTRKIEAIGFCKLKNSAYYESSGFRVFYDKVKHLIEIKDNEKFIPRIDQDIVSISLTDDTALLFEKINQENPAYLLFE
jgi:hypothetical protein